MPGDTGVHKIKWDDTDNYWEVNASFNIDDTGQFVLPKGTTAQKPAAAATATVPAATTGALRYNYRLIQKLKRLLSEQHMRIYQPKHLLLLSQLHWAK